jgi:hypothetical protein
VHRQGLADRSVQAAAKLDPRRRVGWLLPERRLRYSHRSHPNALIIAGRIDSSLPFIKQQGVKTLTKTYTSIFEALRGIDADIETFYQKSYPEVYSNQKTAVQAAIADLQHILSDHNFPLT